MTKKFLSWIVALFVGLFGFISFSNASQLYGYAKFKAKNTNIPSYAPSGTTFYTDLATMDLNGYTGTIKLFVQSNYNCSPGNIMVKNGNMYTRYQMLYISSGSLCVSPEISVSGDSFEFFYSTTQNVNNAYDVQMQLLDLDSFNNSIIAYTTTINSSVSLPTTCSVGSMSSINVFYNGFNDVESFTCDGDTSIYLDGNYNYISSNSLFSPYINIHYTDSDNQVLTGEYEKSDLFLQGQYNKTYTGGSNNYWVFVPIESPNLNIISYEPIFDVEFTGDIIDTGNIFNNFAENSLKFTLSNVPNYIQYVIIIMLLFFILGFIRKFRRK